MSTADKYFLAEALAKKHIDYDCEQCIAAGDFDSIHLGLPYCEEGERLMKESGVLHRQAVEEAMNELGIGPEDLGYDYD